MKTIEERACEIVVNRNNDFARVQKFGYIKGATEQLDIDIERAWDYFAFAVSHLVEEEDMPKAKEEFIRTMKG